MRNFLTEIKVLAGQILPQKQTDVRKYKQFFLRASVVAVTVAQMTAKVLEYWRGRNDLFPRLSRSLPLPSRELCTLL